MVFAYVHWLRVMLALLAASFAFVSFNAAGPVILLWFEPDVDAFQFNLHIVVAVACGLLCKDLLKVRSMLPASGRRQNAM